MGKNWEGVTEKVEAKLLKWKWLLPQMSLRGRTLVLNNLVASQLWHRLNCVDPPPGLLTKIQRIMVNFFWGGLHWVPQGVLFLAKEEGGQGLVHLASRTATFRIQFIQKYLTGPADLVWRDATSCILRRANNLGLDDALFLTDSKLLNLKGLPLFYQGVFKSWALFYHDRNPEADSLHWLLREPLVLGARLDVSSPRTPGLTAALTRSGTLLLQQLVDAAGPELSNAQALGSLLGLRSIRTAQQILKKVETTLSGKEKELLKGKMEPNPTDPFPDITLSPNLGDRTGPLLCAVNKHRLTLHRADKETLYRNCTKCIHQAGLSNRRPTVWSERLDPNGPGPQWRILYKPPLKKRTGDLQWRILHGAIASNAFLSVLNPTLSDQCGFCNKRETTYHIFTECKRLTTFFTLLTMVFSLFNIVFTKQIFIMGAPYSKNHKNKWELLNFINSEAKLAIYVSRKNRIENRDGQEAIAVWKTNIKARLGLEYSFYKQLGDMEAFKKCWCFNNIVCSILNDQLTLAPFLTK